MKNFKKWMLMIIAMISIMTFGGCTAEADKVESKETLDRVSTNAKNKESQEDLLSGLYQVEIVVKDYGSIIVELDADVAPIR